MCKKVLIVCVNYNSYDSLTDYLKSIDSSASLCGECQVEVIIADNSTKPEEVEASAYRHVAVKVSKFDNRGYLGAAQSAINNHHENILTYDYVAITNVDLLMDESFFKSLSLLNVDENIAWIAPQIWSEDEKRDRNPKTMQRKSEKRLLAIKRMYQYPFLEWLYTHTMYKRKKLYTQHPECDLFAGHGSFMILTRAFFKKYPTINYPVFLFGEESYLGELILKAGLRVRYIPSLKVYDSEHVSTGRMNRKIYCKHNIEAINYILDTFYEHD